MIKDLSAKDKTLKLTESEHQISSSSSQTLDIRQHRIAVPEGMEINTRKITAKRRKTYIKRVLEICRGFPLNLQVIIDLLMDVLRAWERITTKEQLEKSPGIIQV